MGCPCKAIEFSKPPYLGQGVSRGKYNDVSGNTSIDIGELTDRWGRVAEYSKQWTEHLSEEESKLLKEIKNKWSF